MGKVDLSVCYSVTLAERDFVSILTNIIVLQEAMGMYFETKSYSKI